MRRHLKDQAVSILREGRDMTLASLCEDGAPHAVVVSYASEGLRIFFGCAADSRKALNLGRDGRAAATVTLPYASWAEIRGVSLMGRARRIDDMTEIDRIGRLLLAKFPQAGAVVAEPYQSVRVFEFAPTEISVLDYARGFGHVEHAAVAAEDLTVGNSPV